MKISEIHIRHYKRFTDLTIMDLLIESVGRGNPMDDVKSASGTITVELKRILSLTRCGNTRESFILNTLAPLITPDMNVYQEMEHSIFG